MIPSEATTVCYTDVDDIYGGDPGPGPNPGAVYGTVEIVDLGMIEEWGEDFHPFDRWSEEPGDPAVHFHIDIPLSECDERQPVERYSFTLSCGEIAGTPVCWHDSGACHARGYGVSHPWCCYSQLLICRFISSLPIIGAWLCPYSECTESFWECDPFIINRDNPCHSCGFCGGSDLLCHIVPGGHC